MPIAHILLFSRTFNKSSFWFLWPAIALRDSEGSCPEAFRDLLQKWTKALMSTVSQAENHRQPQEGRWSLSLWMLAMASLGLEHFKQFLSFWGKVPGAWREAQWILKALSKPYNGFFQKTRGPLKRWKLKEGTQRQAELQMPPEQVIIIHKVQRW